MEEILKQLNELLATVKVKITKCDEERNKNASIKSALDNREQELTLLEKNLMIREDRVKVAEDIEKERKAIAAKAKEIKDKERSLSAREEALVISTKKLEDKKQSDLKEIEDLKAKLRKQSLEIETEKKQFKNKILADIEKAAKGK